MPKIQLGRGVGHSPRIRRMRRLYVQFSQIEECIRTALFAVDAVPRNPPLQRGETLLLQLVKQDAERLGRLGRRIEFALVFDSVRPDPTGAESRAHWPNAGKTWKYILVCSETIPTIPFSLEKLPLSRQYGGQTNAQHIDPLDEAIIEPYLKGGTQPEELAKFAGVMPTLHAIRNYDTITRLSPPRVARVREHERRLTDPWLTDALKSLYDHKCQICVHDFKPRYGLPYADTRFLTKPETTEDLVSKNLIVVCPNHRAIIGATSAKFDTAILAFRYPNGLVEKVLLRDHLLD
jgi:hypothetical protein